MIEPTMKHEGILNERLSFEYVLPEPQDYTLRPRYSRAAETTWRFTTVRVGFSRSKAYGADWSLWSRRITGEARNVLKSGELGQRTPHSSDRFLVGERYTIADQPAEWARPWLAPILEDAEARRVQATWNGAW